MSPARVKVGGLSSDVCKVDLLYFFKKYSGSIMDIYIRNSFAFVEFDVVRDAEDAVYELNGKRLLERRVTIELTKDKIRDGRRDRHDDRYGSRRFLLAPPQRTKFRLIVENLSSSATCRDLKNYMRQAGEVAYTEAHQQRCNEGIVEFFCLSDMDFALYTLDNTEFEGRRIRLIEHRTGERSIWRSCSRSPSPKRYRRSDSYLSRTRPMTRNYATSPSERLKIKTSEISRSHSRSRDSANHSFLHSDRVRDQSASLDQKSHSIKGSVERSATIDQQSLSHYVSGEHSALLDQNSGSLKDYCKRSNWLSCPSRRMFRSVSLDKESRSSSEFRSVSPIRSASVL